MAPVQRSVIRGRPDLDRRYLDDRGAQCLQTGGKRSRLRACPGHHDALAEQREPLEPVQFFPQPYHFPHDDGGWRLHAAPLDQFRQSGQGAAQRLLVRARGPAHRHGRRLRGSAARNQLMRDLRKRGEPHENHQRFAHPHFVPIDLAHGVTGDERDRRGMLAMRQRHAGIRGDAQRRGDSRDHFERNSRVRQRLRLFAAPAEDERVAALQPHHHQAPPRPLDQQFADLFLAERVRCFLLPHVQPLRLRRRQFHQRLGSQIVIEDRIGGLKNAPAFDGD